MKRLIDNFEYDRRKGGLLDQATSEFIDDLRRAIPSDYDVEENEDRWYFYGYEDCEAEWGCYPDRHRKAALK